MRVYLRCVTFCTIYFPVELDWRDIVCRLSVQLIHWLGASYCIETYIIVDLLEGGALALER